VDDTSRTSTRRRIVPEQRLSTTMVMAIAAICATLIAIFGDSAGLGGITVAFALLGLVPWALVAGGVRLHPLLFMAMSTGAAAVIVLVDRNPGGMFPIMLAVVWLTRSDAGGPIVAAALVSAVAIMVGLAVIEGTAHETGVVYFLGGVGVSWLAGSMIRRQELLVAELREAQERQAAQAAANERTRIAREVHDVVAHSLTVTMLHVTGARRALANDPARAADALERAEAVGRESLDSIRQVVGLLRTGDEDGAGVDAPLPAIADIPDLVDKYRGAGLHITDELCLDGLVTDATTSLTAFRVVQEALANVLQHAPGAPVVLTVAGDPSCSVLRILAENPAPGTTARNDRVGLGLRGMAERVRAVGGSLEVGATNRQTFRVDATLPLRHAAGS
jgi:signal transduction histidine kinase